MSSPPLEQVLKKNKVTIKISSKQVSDGHLEEISRSFCKEWKSLPSQLDLPAITTDDIDQIPGGEQVKRHTFLCKWKNFKGSGATYRQLMSALLRIGCTNLANGTNDAEGVCLLLKNSTLQPSASHAGPSQMPSAAGSSATTSLAVKCSNAYCKWKGSIDSLTEHSATCKYRVKLCPNECRDDRHNIKKIVEKDYDNHVKKDCPNREYVCPDCEEKGKYSKMMQEHDERCKKKLIPCEHPECTKVIQRRGMKRHLDACAYTEVPCKYQAIGCDVKMKKIDISTHENKAELHLPMALEELVSMKKVISAMQQTTEQNNTVSTPTAPQRQHSMF